MSLRIAHNVEAMNIHRNLNASANRLARSMERLSSGLRINRAADDAAGLGVSERMRGQIRGLEQANRNIQDGMSLVQTIDGVLNEVHSILQRARDLAVQWNSGTLSSNDKWALRQEMFALSNEIGRLGEVTEFNGIKLLQDPTAVITLQVGANSGETITFNLARLMGPTVGDLVRPNTFWALPWAEADVAGFDMHIDDVSKARGRFGAIQNRLEHAHGANTALQENLMQAESRIRDTDMALEMVAFSRHQLLQQSGMAALMFANKSPARVLDLLSPRGGANLLAG